MPPTTRKTTAKKTTRTAPVGPADPPAVPVVEDPYAVTTWGNTLSERPEDLTVPSGQTCLVRRPGVEQLLREGVLFESDQLTTIVHENIERSEKGLEPKDVDIQAILSDPKQFEELMSTVDRVVAATVLKPTVKRAVNDPTNRQPGVVYTDQIDLIDKFAIMQFALGGNTELAPFLAEPAAGVGGVRARQGTRGPAKRTSRRK